DVDDDHSAARPPRTLDTRGVDDVHVSGPNVGEQPRAFGFEQIADCGSMRVVGLRLEAGQRVPEHRNAIPVALIVTGGRLLFDDGAEDVAVRERYRPALRLLARGHVDEVTRPGVDLRRRLAARATVPVELPVRIPVANLSRGQALVAPVVHLAQELGDLRMVEP